MTSTQRVRAALGWMLIIIGVTVMAGWIGHWTLLVAPVAGNIVMVFNAALCFALTGCAIVATVRVGPPPVLIPSLIGAILIFFGSAIFLEFLIGRSIGIDWQYLHAWLRNGNTLPGRMAPNAALGFVAIGVVLIALCRDSSLWRARLILTLTFAIVMIGITGLVAYKLNPDLLFGWSNSERMALPAALGFLITGIALWLQWQTADWYGNGAHFRPDDKILFVATAVLTLVTIAAGLSCFVLQQAVLERQLRESMASTVMHRVALFHQGLQHAADRALSVSLSHEIVALATDAEAHHGVTPTPNVLMFPGIASVMVYDPQHRLIVQLGSSGNNPVLLAQLELAPPARLFWDNGLQLETVSPVLLTGGKIGEVVIRQSLQSLWDALVARHELGHSAQLLVCSDRSEHLLCLPSRSEEQPTIQSGSSNFGKMAPMVLAVSGTQGITSTLDQLGHNVNAAYAPLAPGLGIAIKQDTVEVYAPIRERFAIVVLLLLGLLGFGVLILRLQLTPLARRLIQSELAASEKEVHLRTLLYNVGEGILTVNMDGVIEGCNPAAVGIFGEVKGHRLASLIPAYIGSAGDTGFSVCVGKVAHQILGIQNVELTGQRRDGSEFPLELTVNAMQRGGLFLYVAIMRDISARKEAELELQRLARFDTLTALPNRALFMERLGQALLRARRSGHPLAIMFLDLDGFKQINDTLGHQSGDELLVQFSRRISDLVRSTDTVARLGGDEFTILLEELQDGEAAAMGIAEKIIAAMRQPFALGEHSRQISTSIGVVIYQLCDREITIEELLHSADTAMYAAKRQGKNQVCLGSVVAEKSDSGLNTVDVAGLRPSSKS